MNTEFFLEGVIWLYNGDTPWCFLSIDEETSSEIKDNFGITHKKGWGSLKVRVVIGDTSWNTSIFPNNKTNTYLLPLKKEIREKEVIKVGDKVKYTINILI